MVSMENAFPVTLNILSGLEVCAKQAFSSVWPDRSSEKRSSFQLVLQLIFIK